jgi:hypothetical protein
MAIVENIRAAKKPLKAALGPDCAAPIPANFRVQLESRFDNEFPEKAHIYEFRNSSYGLAFAAANQGSCKMRVEEKREQTAV